MQRTYAWLRSWNMDGSGEGLPWRHGGRFLPVRASANISIAIRCETTATNKIGFTPPRHVDAGSLAKVTIVRNGESKEYSVTRSDDAATEGRRLNRAHGGAATN